MAKRASKKKGPPDPMELVAAVIETVVAVVADPEPLDALPPADFVPEVAPAAGAGTIAGPGAPRKKVRAAPPRVRKPALRRKK